MSTLLTLAALAIGGLLAVALMLLALLWIALWVRTRRLTKRGLRPVHDPEPDTDELPIPTEGHAVSTDNRPKPPGLIVRAPECDGGYQCTAPSHIEGCLSGDTKETQR